MLNKQEEYFIFIKLEKQNVLSSRKANMIAKLLFLRIILLLLIYTLVQSFTYTYLSAHLSSKTDFTYYRTIESIIMSIYTCQFLMFFLSNCMLFDSYVSPILSYVSEVWGFYNEHRIETLQLKYIKHFIPLIAVSGE